MSEGADWRQQEEIEEQEWHEKNQLIFERAKKPHEEMQRLYGEIVPGVLKRYGSTDSVFTGEK